MAEISKKIMRRIYYAFFLRQVSHPIFLHTALLLISFFALSRVVSIPNVLINLSEVQVKEIANFFIGALLNTQTVTIMWLLVITATFLSLTWRLFFSKRPSATWEMEDRLWA